MKDSEFLELLNLYVDHEISADQAARLEAEVTGSAERRKIYRQYCMIHKGCSLLSGSFAEEAPAPERRREPVLASQTGRFWGWSGLFAAGGLAAACLAALVATRLHTRPAVPAAPQVALARTSSADVRVMLPAQRNVNFPAPFSGNELTTVINVRAWNNPGLEPAALTQGDPLAWTDSVQLAPLAHDSLDATQLFKSQPMLLPANPSSSPVATPALHQDMDSVGFQFQR